MKELTCQNGFAAAGHSDARIFRIAAVAAIPILLAWTRLASAAACTNDINCLTGGTACGTEVCSWNVNPHACVPAGQQPAGSDGWCQKTTDCKCRALGATCVGNYCSFTVAPDGGAHDAGTDAKAKADASGADAGGTQAPDASQTGGSSSSNDSSGSASSSSSASSDSSNSASLGASSSTGFDSSGSTSSVSAGTAASLSNATASGGATSSAGSNEAPGDGGSESSDIHSSSGCSLSPGPLEPGYAVQWLGAALLLVRRRRARTRRAQG